jgi:DNA-binding NarL/FixJ family response regulator
MENRTNGGQASHNGEIRVRLGGYILTTREEEVIHLVIQGLSNKEIAASCHISVQTVKDHLKHAYQKIGVHQRSALIAQVLQITSLARDPEKKPNAKRVNATA